MYKKEAISKYKDAELPYYPLPSIGISFSEPNKNCAETF